MSFKDKVVLVTGGSSGIGASVAVSFAKEGASVVIIGRNEANLKNVAQSCGQYGQEAFIIKADIANDAEANTVVDQTVEKFGKLDILVNNAGVLKTGEILKGDALKAYDETFSVNLRAVVNITSLAVPHLIKTKGNIVNVSSILATIILAKHHEFTAYGMAKAALNYFTRSLASELGPKGVRANIVSPGPTKTALVRADGIPYDWSQWDRYAVLGKIVDAVEIADLILFLASDKAKSVTGAEFTIDSGTSL